MKRQLVIGPMLVAAMAGGIYCEAALAFGGGRGGRDYACDGRGPEGRGRGNGGPVGMARELGLSSAQQKQVRTLLAAERKETATLRQKLEEARDQRREAMRAETFDEAAVRKAVTAENNLRTELMVARARTHGKISAILTPEQREKAAELAPPQRGPERGGQPPEEF